MSGSSTTSKISRRWESGYTVNSGYIILDRDTSFKMDDTVFDWLNIAFTGVEAYIGLSTKHSIISFGF